MGTQRTVSMIRSFEHPDYVTISTKTYAVDTQKYRLDETVLLSTQKQMLKIYFFVCLTTRLYTERRLFITRYSLFITRYSLFITQYSLFITRYSPFITRYSLFITRYSLFITRYSPFITQYSLFITRYSLLTLLGSMQYLWSPKIS